MVDLFRAADAVRVVGPAELPLVLMELLENSAERQAIGRRALDTLHAHTGATRRTLEVIAPLLPPASPISESAAVPAAAAPPPAEAGPGPRA
jgi:3-deoxy-D-manno-octulosonic-acid transferase